MVLPMVFNPHVQTTKPGKGNLTAADDSKKAWAVVLWTKLEDFHLTDTLLTLIEESVTWKGALGFDKGAVNDPTPTRKGKSFIQRCEDIVEAFFLVCNVDINFTKAILPALKTIIKNQINSLKSIFNEYCNKLGETGHGFVTSGHSDELYEGSEAENIYEAIEKKFPQYLCMNDLMGGSPISSWKVIANSQSMLNLSVLGAEDDNDNDNNICYILYVTLLLYDSFILGGWEHGPKWFWPRLKLALPSKWVMESPVISCASKKRKTSQDLVREVADAEHQAHLIMNEANAKKHTAREQVKHQTAYDTAVAVEQMHIKA
ncbi:hypothetical protein PAXINDRAFT_11302 [Paxillus involutus ATCC 200175]|uniref:Uncharacterized protein n=1 Tax=Paxillus involutus ATCC 200175 TaxID=664439 RepID=A0A0C9SZZ8_PAXIN|nr:hypothetical protein PAXINDRAFT_11302 [Paxillus involutus ATCC 200175]